MRSALHVTNGDSAAGTLVQTTLVERVLPWRDVLHDGPVPDVAEDEFRRVRAAALAEDDPHEQDRIRSWLEQRDGELAANADGRYVLWFEADLYDQLQLVQVLSRLDELGVDPDRITVVCVGEYPGIAHFGGLGELNAPQLERVAEFSAVRVTASALKLAGDAWAAFRSDNPEGLLGIARTHHRELRFTAQAFDRLGREYPSSRDGLALTERRILAAAGEGAPAAGEVFRRVAVSEVRPFLGDLSFFRIVARLVDAAEPPLTADTHPVRMSTELRLTDVGRRLLAGRDDYVRLNGLDRWVGGVDLSGVTARWRWHEGIESVVPSSAVGI